MSTQDNGGPALPVVELDRVTGAVCDQHFGMSMRDYFAAKAMPAWDMSSLHDIEAVYERCATHAYRMADAMLKAREQWIAFITPRDGIPLRYDLTATDETAAHAEARRIGAAFGSFTYLVRAA